MYKKDTINKGVEGSTDFLACQLILSSTDVNTVMPERKKKGEIWNEQEKEKKERKAKPDNKPEFSLILFFFCFLINKTKITVCLLL